MKKIIALFILFISVSFISKPELSIQNGFYFLAENEKYGQTVYDVDGESKFQIEPNVILDASHFKKVLIKEVNLQSHIEKFPFLILNNNGRKKWNELTKRIEVSKETMLFIFENKVLYGLSFYYSVPEYTEFKIHVEKENVDHFVSVMQNEINAKKIK